MKKLLVGRTCRKTACDAGRLTKLHGPSHGRSVAVEEISQASWRRCEENFALDRHQVPRLVQLEHDALKAIYETMAEGLTAADAIIGDARRIAHSTGFHMLLCDRTATVIESYPDIPGGLDLTETGLVPGTIWQERLVGTNGIGTCVATGQAVTIAGPAHFNVAFSKYNCSAAPIFSPDGELWGVFNITGFDDRWLMGDVFALEFALDTANRIGGVLFRLRHGRDCVIALAENAYVPLSLDCLVALDGSGFVRGATKAALHLLGVKTYVDVLNQPFEALLNLEGRDWRAQPSGATTVDDRRLFLTPFRSPAGADCGGKSYSLKSIGGDFFDGDAQPLDHVAGSDTSLNKQVAVCRRLLDSELPILLLGETGVGKDTFARAFHAESSRAEKPYIAVNCAAIPESLLASELFGYAPGTFTGGLKRGKEGKIVASDGGTLFLDEIGDMPLELQAHLLRVLEDRVVTPLGSAVSVSVDIRIICATHRNLVELVAKNSFRKDLYFRIKGAQVNLPPLRARDDFSQLLSRLIALQMGPSAANRLSISGPVMEAFRQYRWPGNVRELKSTIRYFLAVCSDNVVTLDDLPDEILVSSIDALPDAGGTFEDELFASQSGMGSESTERQTLIDALRRNRWNVTKTAKELNISRATLHRKISRHRIVPPNARD